eukprot:SM000305S11810  [mRNA]  locus=s305:7817:10282:- [translate_table: standard]
MAAAALSQAATDAMAAFKMDRRTAKLVIGAAAALLLFPLLVTLLSSSGGGGGGGGGSEVGSDVETLRAQVLDLQRQLDDALVASGAAPDTADCMAVQRPQLTPHDPWRTMKWVGRPAPCKVKGYEIEEIDFRYNMRRGFALHLTEDVEDKTHVLPYLLASHDYDKYANRARRFYIDLGGNKFSTSVSWFLRWYPLDFTEIHVYEVRGGVFVVPQPSYADDDEIVLNAGSQIPKQLPIPDWQLERIRSYTDYVSHEDKPEKGRVNITRIMLEDWGLTAEDTVIVKMDIENAEWPLLAQWMDMPIMADVIDELFVEVHYAEQSMANFGWGRPTFKHTREEAVDLIHSLRQKGFYAHVWP